MKFFVKNKFSRNLQALKIFMNDYMLLYKSQPRCSFEVSIYYKLLFPVVEYCVNMSWVQ